MLLKLYLTKNFNFFFINFYDFFWMNMWTLFLLLIILILLVSLLFNQIVVNTITIGFIAFFYLYEVGDFIKCTASLILLNPNLMEIIVLLVNPINKIHPCVLYASGGFFLLSILLVLKYFNTNLTVNFFIQRNFNVLKLEVKNNLVLASTALVLGSWWAFQEGTWGGWWGWDPSEVLGLILIFIPFVLFHSSFKVFFHKQGLTFLYLFIIVSINYYFIQLNFELVSHNFGIFYHYFFSNNLFFFENIYISTLTLYFLFSYFSNIKYIITNYTCSTYFTLNKLFLFFYIIFLYYFFILFFYSFSFITNYFLWTYFSTLVSGSPLIFNQSNSLLYIILLLLFNNFSYQLLAYYLILNCVIYNFFILSLFSYNIKMNLLRVIHVFLISFLVLSKLSNNLPFSIYGFKTILEDFILHLDFNTILYSVFGLNGWNLSYTNSLSNTNFRGSVLHEIFIINFPKLQYVFQFLSNCANFSIVSQISLRLYNYFLFQLNPYLFFLFVYFLLFSVSFLVFNTKYYFKSRYLF